MARVLLLSLLLIHGATAFTSKGKAPKRAKVVRLAMRYEYEQWYPDQERYPNRFSDDRRLYSNQYEEPRMRQPYPSEVVYDSPTTTNLEPEDPDLDRVVAAGVGSGVLGLLVGGPVGAAVLGFSSAYAAETLKENSAVGDSARAVGDVALNALDKSLEINEKHKVVDKTLAVASTAWETAKELDREHKIVQKAKDVAIYSGVATVDFVRKHNLVERGFKGLGKGLGWVTERVVAGSLDGISDQERDRAALKPRRKARRAKLPNDMSLPPPEARQ